MSPSDSIPQKRCNVCEREFPATTEFFHRRKASKEDGLCYTCKECAIARTKQNAADNPERIRANARRYADEHHDERLAYLRNYTAQHREIAQRRALKWAKDNPEKVRARNQNRIARKKAADGQFTRADIRTHYETQNGLCAYCGIRLFDDYHIDHYVPLIRGGSNWPDNLLLSCADCNLQKNECMVEEWQDWRGW